MYQILVSKNFLEKLSGLSKDQQTRIGKIKEQLRENPFVGKPLGYKWFREKKIEGFRLYFLIYEREVCVLMVDFSNKKQQQATINAIIQLFAQYREEVMKYRASSNV